MAYETIVAVFDTAEHAEQAVRDLEAAGVPSNAITRHAGQDASVSGTTTTTDKASGQEPGFWARLFGEEPAYEHEASMFDRGVGQGSTVVSVRVSEEHTVHVTDILERHNPIDLEDRSSGWESTAASSRVGEDLHGANAGIGGTGMVGGVGSGVSAAGAGTRSDADTSDTLRAGARMGTTGAATTGSGLTGREETIPLSEEQIAVGKRAINRGTTRVRRYVVETPVEEAVALREERVSVERRPVSSDRPVTDDAFTDRTIEVSETSEEAVVSKTARVREEVVINKDATERTETVRDTVRREDVEITKDAGTTGTGTSKTGPADRTKR